MSIDVTTTQIIQFQNNMELALQPQMSKLWPHTTPHTGSGKLVELTNLFGIVNAQDGDTRHGDTQYLNTPHFRRWCAKDTPTYMADLVDNEDRLKAGIDIQGGYVKTFAAGLARKKDERFLEGFYGVARTGETGTTLVSFPAGQIVPVTAGAAAATGMNIEKIIEARRLLVAGQVDMDRHKVRMALTSLQYSQLLRDVRASNKDYVGGAVIENGKLTMLMGIEIIEMEFGNATYYPDAAPLTLDGNGYRRIPVWAEEGMARVEWGPSVYTTIDRLPTKRNSVQVYAECDVAAARMQEGFCVQVLCAE